MVVVDEDERTVAKSSGGEGIHNGNDVAIVYVLPFLDRPDGSLITQSKSCTSLALKDRGDSKI